jgi:FtsP/CotA-like multicopper oxidase with cupredoxin domain
VNALRFLRWAIISNIHQGLVMRTHHLGMVALLVAGFLATPAIAKTSEYHLIIDKRPVNITGMPIEKITINGGIPGPVLRFTEGDDAVINVTNNMKEPTSVHWHGLIVPGSMDGVTDFNDFKAIEAGKSFTYRFPLKQAGTYWYHSHTGGQEQDGHYGAIIVTPKGGDSIHAERDYVVLVSDFSQEDSGDIIKNLKKSSDYYATARRTLGDFFHDVTRDGFNKAWKDARDWGKMRMARTDLADVTGYTFLVNGKSPDQNWTGLFKLNERVRLRFINAGTMSMFDVRILGLKMSVVQSDGQSVEPVSVDEFRFAPGETYDVIVTPKEDTAYTIAAEPIDRTGFAIGTLATHEGMKGDIPRQRPRAQLSMADMNMEQMMKDDPNMDMSAMDMESGWAKAGTPEGQKALSYADLRYAGIQKDQRKPERTIDVRLGGNMERYIWTINDKTFNKAEPIHLKYGERVRLKFTNETMMAHPMHLHGMFVQLENGQPAAKLPNKHTVIIPPGQSYSVLLTADEAGEWAFHCHLLYHMASGMMRQVVVAKLDAADVPDAATTHNGGHHAH